MRREFLRRRQPGSAAPPAPTKRAPRASAVTPWARVAHVDGQRFLAARHRQVDLGQQLRVEQRAVQRALRVATRRNARTARRGCCACRESCRGRAPACRSRRRARRSTATCSHSVELVIEEGDVERRVVDDPLARRARSRGSRRRDRGTAGWPFRSSQVMPWTSVAPAVDLALRIEVAVQRCVRWAGGRRARAPRTR